MKDCFVAQTDRILEGFKDAIKNLPRVSDTTCQCTLITQGIALQQSDGSGRSRLTGWEAIEDHFVKHDQGLVNGFNDDINTLLTFVRSRYFLSTHLCSHYGD